MEKCLFDSWYYDHFQLGSFFTILFEAFMAGDATNRIRIITAFPEQFKDSQFVKEWMLGENIAYERIRMSFKTKEAMPIGPISMDVIVASCVIAQIQLATRHPKNTGSSRQIAEAFARELQNIVSRVSPENAELIEKGWNPTYDE